jgi:50S ribosomal protein L16 3-hydroxylase
MHRSFTAAGTGRPEPTATTPLLGGLSPERFMRRHWQKRPLLIRQAMPGLMPPVDRATLFALAQRDGVESRLVVHGDGGWRLRHGPLPRRALPSTRRPGWTLLVQGVDLHVPAARALLDAFRFVPDARLDDLMVSYATDGGGVGPHVDSYDVFLLQVHGRRRWRIGRVPRPELVPDVPLKILADFQPEQSWVLEPGDMLYLPPGWGHDGVAEGECMTCSVGFRAPTRDELAREVLQRHLDALDPDDGPGATLYRDPGQPATARPAEVPAAMQAAATAAVQRLVADPAALACALGEWLSEPKAGVWFDAGDALPAAGGLRLDRRTRMLWDARCVYVNGESYRVAGRDARLMRRLADDRVLSAADRVRLGADAAALVDEWADAGWLHAQAEASVSALVPSPVSRGDAR